jgi:hypothetical protein
MKAAALTLAVLLSGIATMDTSYAQGPLEDSVALANIQGTGPANIVSALPAIPGTTTTDATEPVTIDFNGVQSVDASSLALVALAAKQVQLAKTPIGAQQVAKELIASQYASWSSSQVSCLNQLWNGESHWNFQAHNYRSGAHGIAQALPADKMEIIATDWRTNPVTQIKWGLSYIKARYGTPCKALAHKHWRGYY